MAPPPPPPPSSEDTTMLMAMDPAMLVTPPQKHKTHSYHYNHYNNHHHQTRDRRGTATSSPATSHASSAASPAQQLLKTRSAGEVLSPRVRGSRMDPYPRYSPRKRLSADFSDGTYSADSGAESPKSEKGGWRIHAAVAGPFLTGPLAKDFTARLDELRSPRGKKADAPDFDHSGLLLFPVVPDFVAPAITPEVFQASIQPAPVVQAQPQPEPDHSAVVSSTEGYYYPQNTDQYYAPPPATNAAPDASWDATAQMQMQQDQYYYGEQQQQYSAEQQQYYYNNGYDQQYTDVANTNGEYNYQQSYESYPAASEQAPVAETLNAEAFPPLPSLSVATPEVEASSQVATEVMSSNQVPEPVTPAASTSAPGSPVRRQRAPSYAEIVTGAAHTAPATAESEAPKAEASKPTTAGANFATFDQLSDGIAESMSRILAKSNGNKTHAEVEFSCLVHRIQTQLKLMGRVTNSLHLKQMKTLHKLQKSEIQKLSIESSNMELVARVQKYEQEQEELKKQLTEALEAKDVRLKDAVDQLSSKIDSLKNSTDASTSSLASEIDAIRKCSSSDDLEKRVEEIGQVLDYLIENQSETSPKSGTAPPMRRSSKFEGRRLSVGSWKAIALYAIVVWAASLCGVWVGVKYAGNIHQSPVVTEPVVQHTVVEAPAVSVAVPSTIAVFEEVITSVDVVEPEVREVAVEMDQASSINVLESVFEPVDVDEASVNVEETIETVAEEMIEVSAPADQVEEVEAPVQLPVSESEPALVFTFEQMASPTSSCFSCPSDHSTMASFFCEMLSEVISGSSIVVEEQLSIGQTLAADAVVESNVAVATSPAGDVLPNVVVESVQSVSVSENWDSIAVPTQDDELVIEAELPVAEAVAAPAEIVVEAVAEEPVTTELVEAVIVSQTTERTSVSNMVSPPLAHALYVWCPSLFDMHAEGNDAASGPLSGLARALTSLSSQILAEHTSSTVEEITEEHEVAAVEVIEDVQEIAVERVDEEVFVADEISVITETVSVPEVETVVEEAEVETDVAEVEVAAVIEPIMIETVVAEVAEVSSSRWAAEHLLINAGVMCGTAEVAAPAVSVNTEEIEASIPVWSISEVPAVVAEEKMTFVNTSTVADAAPAVAVVETVEAVEVAPIEAVVAVAESTAVSADVAPSVEETAHSCALESCPRFEHAIFEETKFANASLIATGPTTPIAADSTTAGEEVVMTIGSSPAVDLKSLLLYSL